MDRAEIALFPVKTNMTMRPVRQSQFTHDDARVVVASARHAHTSRTFSAVSQDKTFFDTDTKFPT